MSDRLDALRRASAAAPDDLVLQRMLAEELDAAGERAEAVEAWLVLLQKEAIPVERLIPAGRAALAEGELDAAAQFLAAARRRGIVEGVSALAEALDAARADSGVLRLVPRPAGGERAAAPADAPGEVEAAPKVKFGDVGGLDEVKKLLHRRILLPLERKELFERFRRKAGGGILLYGPPGCGKTLLARAVAGETGRPFVNVRIEEVLDPWLGMSERNLHDAFERARAEAPSVLFLDEIDALAFTRRRHHGNTLRTLVDQLLQELDAIGAENRDLLVLAATNAPWDVEEAMQRPGRFDRAVFVPPPDRAARLSILQAQLADRPTGTVDLKALAERTALFSGADLVALVERAVDEAIETALTSSADVEGRVEKAHLETALASMVPTTLDWIEQARTFVEFANRSERWRDVAAWLRSKEARKS